MTVSILAQAFFGLDPSPSQPCLRPRLAQRLHIMASEGDSSSWSAIRRDRQQGARRRDQDQMLRRLGDLDCNIDHVFKKFDGISETLNLVLAGQALIMTELHIDFPSPSALPPTMPPPVHFTIFDESDITEAKNEYMGDIGDNHNLVTNLDAALMETFSQLDDMLTTNATLPPTTPQVTEALLPHDPVGHSRPQALHCEPPMGHSWPGAIENGSEQCRTSSTTPEQPYTDRLNSAFARVSALIDSSTQARSAWNAHIRNHHFTRNPALHSLASLLEFIETVDNHKA